MVFAEELRAKQKETFEKSVKEFAEKTKPKLERSAEEGYSGWKLSIDDQDDKEKVMLSNPQFTKELEKHFEGLEIRIEEEPYKHIFFPEKSFVKRKLCISW